MGSWFFPPLSVGKGRVDVEKGRIRLSLSLLFPPPHLQVVSSDLSIFPLSFLFPDKVAEGRGGVGRAWFLFFRTQAVFFSSHIIPLLFPFSFRVGKGKIKVVKTASRSPILSSSFLFFPGLPSRSPLTS